MKCPQCGKEMEIGTTVTGNVQGWACTHCKLFLTDSPPVGNVRTGPPEPTEEDIRAIEDRMNSAEPVASTGPIDYRPPWVRNENKFHRDMRKNLDRIAYDRQFLADARITYPKGGFIE